MIQLQRQRKTINSLLAMKMRKYQRKQREQNSNSFVTNGIKGRMQEEEDDDNDLDDKGNCTKLTNTIMVAIHIPDHSWMSFNNEGLTIPYNYSPSISSTLLPQDIMDCLIKEPVFIKEIGVSAVSSEVMMEWWKEMINTEPNICDVAGKGYMVHPMWNKYVALSEDQHIEWGDWSSVREKSFDFGWKGYMVEE